MTFDFDEQLNKIDIQIECLKAQKKAILKAKERMQQLNNGQLSIEDILKES